MISLGRKIDINISLMALNQTIIIYVLHSAVLVLDTTKLGQSVKIVQNSFNFY